MIPTTVFEEEDLFKVPVAMPVKSFRQYGGDHCCRKVRLTFGAFLHSFQILAQQQRRQGRVCNPAAGAPRRRRSPTAVDEDLYKIPPELFCQTPKEKRLVRKLLSGCMGLNCVD
ncbi:hypothetical protein KSP40_PGU022766 [Platanthera guangdongensis]|uniref:Uncharacterized protein n=1 Tax=Platanthera guangdongensis TaxID=2320717 RepID=A0ABR2LJF1_9ASPA